MERKRKLDIGDEHSNTKARYGDGEAEDGDNANYWTGKPFSGRYFDILKKRKELPVYEFKDELIRKVKENQVIIIEGETGSGKTTQIPQFLLKMLAKPGHQSIACTQPRRVAAMSIAKRVSEEMDDMTSPNTILKFMTDGMLLREAMIDPLLSKYSCIVLDEAHERTLPTDDLKAVVMSATLDAERFQKYFSGAPLMKVPGRTHPVEIFYSAAPEANYVDSAVLTALQIHQTESKGDILIFLTGEEEIETVCTQLRLEADQMDHDTVGPLAVYPLYSTLPPRQQQDIFRPFGRKIVVSTNIAETSLTIDGIVYVIDPGFSKQKVFNPRVRVESLLVSPISQAKSSFQNDLQRQSFPEILRSRMETVVLTLLRLGIEDLVHFDFMDPPAPETMMRALEHLHYLGALDDEGHNCADEILPKEAAKEADAAKAQFAHEDGDHITLLHAYLAYKDTRQLRNHGIELKPQNFEAPDYYNNIRRCLSTGLFMQVAHLQRQGNYLTAKDHQVVAIHPSSVLNGKPQWVLFQEFVMTTRNYIRSVTPVPVEWLIEEAPHYFDLESWPDGETKSELVSAYRRYAQMKEYQDRKIKEKKEKKEKRG
eukprot:GSChrysophyteH1.ASY1.ANO1.2167.1 assembled CDS